MHVVVIGKLRKVDPPTISVKGFLRGSWVEEIIFFINKIPIKSGDVVIIEGVISDLTSEQKILEVKRIKQLENFYD